MQAAAARHYSCLTIMAKGEVNTVKKALAILDLFAEIGPELSIAEITRELGMPRPTVSRLMFTLEGEGYIRRAPDSRKYCLGIKILRFSSVIHNSIKITTVAGPLLKQLRDVTGETVFLSILDGDESVCLISYEGSQLLRTVVPIGQRSMLYAGADAKVILAHQQQDKINELINKTGLKPLSKNTITDPVVLRQQLDKIRTEGVAISIAERTPGSAAVSCPIWDHHGEVQASVSISFPRARLTDELLDRSIKQLKKLACVISRQIGADERCFQHIFAGD